VAPGAPGARPDTGRAADVLPADVLPADGTPADSTPADTAGGARRARPAYPFTVGAWFGAAERSPTGAFGRVPERALRLLAFRLGWTVARTRHVALDYQVDLVPLARISGPRLLAIPSQCRRGQACQTEWAIADDRAVFGVGGAPIGLQVRARPDRIIQPFAAISGGALVFSRPVPVDDAERFNFTAEAGGGAIVGRPGKLGVMLGYKFHHLSNGGTGRINPGLDGHVIYAGLLRVPK
jgi:hypothetical protein